MSALSGKLPFHKPGIRTGGAPKADLVITIVMLLLIIPLVVVGLRIYVRLRIIKVFGRDDFFMVTAMTFVLAFSISVCFEAKLGSPLGLIGMSSGALKSLMAFHLLYFVAVWAVKMSILSFCYNVFGRSFNSRVKLVVWSIMAIVTTHFVIAFATTLFTCSPISVAWDPARLFFDRCFNIAALQIAHSVVNACTDTLVFALPIALLARTKIDPEKKSVVISVFALGSIAVFASFARIFSTIILATTLDQPVNWIMLPLFTALEVNIAITSASLPALSPLIKLALRRIAKHGGGNGWLSRFDEPYDGGINTLVKPHMFNQADSKSNGGIFMGREHGLMESESSFGKALSFTTVRAVSPYERDERVMIYDVPRLTESGVRPARLQAREAATYGGGDMSLVEMLRTTGPGDDEEWARRKGGSGKAREVLGV